MIIQMLMRNFPAADSSGIFAALQRNFRALQRNSSGTTAVAGQDAMDLEREADGADDGVCGSLP
jgi:hypothetical protein